MIVVAVLGEISYAVRLARLRDYYEEQALGFSIRLWRLRAEDAAPAPPRVAERLSRLVEKYENAAHYPWLPVEPDPPEPA
jgi:hypothetical protein